MMTQQEAAALFQIVNRVPITQAEALWINALVARLLPPAEPETPADVEALADASSV